jgi:hypothetical protein
MGIARSAKENTSTNLVDPLTLANTMQLVDVRFPLSCINSLRLMATDSLDLARLSISKQRSNLKDRSHLHPGSEHASGPVGD